MPTHQRSCAFRILSGWLLCFAFSTEAGEIALSFDDAPTADSAIMSGHSRTQSIIQALQSRHVSDALIFVTTSNIHQDGLKRLQQYEKAGFHFANHSHTHQSANALALEEFTEDLQQASAKLKPFSNTLPYYRFPYLHYGKDDSAIAARQKVLQQHGYANGYVTIDTYDWYMSAALNKAKEAQLEIDFKKAEAIYVQQIWQAIQFYDAIAIKILKRSPKHVLLLHENDTSALFLAALIDHIHQQGWKIISAEEAYQDPIAEHFPATDFHNQGRIAALAHAAGVPAKKLRHVAESTEYIDQLFAEKGVFTTIQSRPKQVTPSTQKNSQQE
ncbi:hypothetical protein TDB9533_03083 [Thalassocella blandensis]|nr:hypothetical protein TDB9533_03083 [Thalassocella blandensis]